MNPQIALGNDHAAELDERQRATLHAASHKAFKVVMLLLVIVYAIVAFRYDDFVITVMIGGIGLIGMFIQWFYMRKDGLDKEIETIDARRKMNSKYFDGRSLMMGAFITAMSIASSYSRDRMTWRSVAFAILLGAVIGSGSVVVARREARYIVDRDAAGGKTPSYNRGRRIGAWIARTFNRE